MGLLTAMYEDNADFTNTFRALGGVSAQPADTDVDGVPASLQKVRSFFLGQANRNVNMEHCSAAYWRSRRTMALPACQRCCSRCVYFRV